MAMVRLKEVVGNALRDVLAKLLKVSQVRCNFEVFWSAIGPNVNLGEVCELLFHKLIPTSLHKSTSFLVAGFDAM
jgi:hypothetical protein